MSTLRSDVQQALRSLLRAPLFTLTAIVILGLGIGVNTAMFSVGDRLLGPLPHPGGDRLMSIRREDPQRVPSEVPFSAGVFQDYRREMSQAEAMAAINFDRVTLSGEGEAQQVLVGRVTPEFFRAAGFHPRIGTAFPAWESGGPTGLVLNHGFWQRRFGGDPAILGRMVRVDGMEVPIAGIMGPEFDLFEQVMGMAPEILMPLAMTPEVLQARYSRSMQVLVRLRPGVTPEAATAEARRIHTGLNAQDPGNPDQNYVPKVVPLKDMVTDRVRPAMLALKVVVGFILLIACTNLSNLLLARGFARRRELALCVALGADRRHLVARLMAEGALLGLGGSAVALVVAAWLLRLLEGAIDGFNLGGAQVAMRFPLHPKALLVTLGLAGLSILVFSFLPAWRASRVQGGDALKGGAKGTEGPGQVRLRGALVVLEVALSMMLLVGAGLMLRSLEQRSLTHPGFDAGNLLTARVSVIPAKYGTPEARAAFARRVLEEAEALPGVKAATLTDSLPLQSGYGDAGYTLEGLTPPPDGYPNALFHRVAPNFFATMGIPLVQGRSFEAFDEVGCVVNETFARSHWPSGEALGRGVRLGGVDGVVHPILGIARDTHQVALGGAARTQIYLASSRAVVGPTTTLCLRTTGAPEAVLPALRTLLSRLDPDLPLAEPRTGAEVVQTSLAMPRILGRMFMAFGGLGLLLAVFGLYGLVSFTVTQRTREIGIRVALGGHPGSVVLEVARQGVVLTALGIGLGVGGALALGQLLRSQLYQVSAADPLSMALAGGTLALASVVATLVPALRAARVQPMDVLRRD